VAVDWSRFDRTALAHSWRCATPFPHIVLDGFLPDASLADLRQAVSREPHGPNYADFYEMMASAEPVAHPTLRRFADEITTPDACRFAADVTGKTPARADLRSYVYLAGSYLLPHSDYQATAGRLLSWALYLLPRASSAGGELELFDCALDREEVVSAKPSTVIDPVENRFVLFDVSPRSLHQVREVTGGGRASLSGWFYA
jgi:Rps23 Pro-64 3,4-dihydroxylase Tpa1-like proline 4-hydroxylase